MLERAEDHRRRQVTDLAIAPCKHGQRRVKQGRCVRVVEADDRDIVRHPNVPGAQLAQATQGEVGAGIDDGAHRLLEVQQGRRFAAACGFGPVAGADASLVDRQPIPQHPQPVARQSFGAGGLALDAAHIANSVVAVDRGQVLNE